MKTGQVSSLIKVRQIVSMMSEGAMVDTRKSMGVVYGRGRGSERRELIQDLGGGVNVK